MPPAESPARATCAPCLHQRRAMICPLRVAGEAAAARAVSAKGRLEESWGEGTDGETEGAGRSMPIDPVPGWQGRRFQEGKLSLCLPSSRRTRGATTGLWTAGTVRRSRSGFASSVAGSLRGWTRRGVVVAGRSNSAAVARRCGPVSGAGEGYSLNLEGVSECPPPWAGAVCRRGLCRLRGTRAVGGRT